MPADLARQILATAAQTHRRRAWLAEEAISAMFEIAKISVKNADKNASKAASNHLQRYHNNPGRLPTHAMDSPGWPVAETNFRAPEAV